MIQKHIKGGRSTGKQKCDSRWAKPIVCRWMQNPWLDRSWGSRPWSPMPYSPSPSGSKPGSLRQLSLTRSISRHKWHTSSSQDSIRCHLEQHTASSSKTHVGLCRLTWGQVCNKRSNLPAQIQPSTNWTTNDPQSGWKGSPSDSEQTKVLSFCSRSTPTVVSPTFALVSSSTATYSLVLNAALPSFDVFWTLRSPASLDNSPDLSSYSRLSIRNDQCSSWVRSQSSSQRWRTLLWWKTLRETSVVSEKRFGHVVLWDHRKIERWGSDIGWLLPENHGELRDDARILLQDV